VFADTHVTTTNTIAITTMDTEDTKGPMRPTATDATSTPSLFTGMQEELGLKLEPVTDVVGVLVIDQVDEPAEN
jgi:uncharacterized protein (TIGR03435 family)